MSKLPSRYLTKEPYEPPDPYRKLKERHRRDHPELYCDDSLLETAPASEALLDPHTPPEYLFLDLWREGELAVLIGEPGVGTSILAVQLAESIARGVPSFGTRTLLSANAASAASPPSAPSLLSSDGDAVVPSSLTTDHRQLTTGKSVLLLDLQHSPSQFRERYIVPSPIPGEPPERYEFSSDFQRSVITDLTIPSPFRGDFERYFRHSLNLAVERSGAQVIIIDDLAALEPTTGGPAALLRRLRFLKLLTITTGLSILVLAGSPPARGGVPGGGGGGRRKRVVSLSSGTQASALPKANSQFSHLTSQFVEIADTVFGLCYSTFAPDFRYIKPLRRNAGCQPAFAASGDTSHFSHLTSHIDQVHVLQLTRSAGPASLTETRPVGSVPSSASYDSSLVLPPSSLLDGPAPSKLAAAPFLGFTFIGTSPEEDHLRDYAAEVRKLERALLLPEEEWTRSGRGGGRAALEGRPVRTASDSDRVDGRTRDRARLKRMRSSAVDALTEGLLDGSYERYLIGD